MNTKRPTSLHNLFLMLTSPVVDEEEQLGVQIFHNFVHEEFDQQGLSDEEILQEDGEGDSVALREVLHGQLAETPDLIERGKRLREIADKFAKSHERVEVQREADKVKLKTLNFNSFLKMLEEVFCQGITKYNLIALFFFCSDVLIRCVKLKLREIGMNLFRWSLKYITDTVVKWVHDNGGWENVLCEVVPLFQLPLKYKKMLATLTLGVVAIASYQLIKAFKK